MKTVIPQKNSPANWVSTLFFLALTLFIFYIALASDSSVVSIVAIFIINLLPFYIAFRGFLTLLFHRIEFDEHGFTVTTILGVKKSVLWTELETLHFRTRLGTSIKVQSNQGAFVIYEGGFDRFHKDYDRFLQRLNQLT